MVMKKKKEKKKIVVMNEDEDDSWMRKMMRGKLPETMQLMRMGMRKETEMGTAAAAL
jgi:transketolase C-terminal domain/subunit